MNIRPVTLAAYVLDPRFDGDKTFDEEWCIASQFIVDLAERQGQQRLDVLSDPANYRAKAETLFGNEIISEAVNSTSCMQKPDCWRSTFAQKSHLTKSALILLSMPASAAIIERCNKAYAMQKSKTRNRLTPARAGKLSVVA